MSMGSKLTLILPALLLALPLSLLGGCGCGFDCNSNSDSDDTALLTLGLSDSLPEDLQQVSLEVESISFKRTGEDDVIVETFTINGKDVPTFSVDLLKYPGTEQLLVIKDKEMEPGSYNEVSIQVNVESLGDSYVQEKASGVLKQLTVAGGKLTLPGLVLAPGNQEFTVEFGLAQALQLQASEETYLLTTNGIRLENNLTDATLSGLVDSALFDTVELCRAKTEPEAGNRVYLYKGIDIAKENLADVFTTGSTVPAPEKAIAPFAVATVLQNSPSVDWEYDFGYLPAGDYTLAFSCDTEDDDPIQYNDLPVPLPDTQLYRITLTQSQKAVCNLTADARCK
jgi:Domain of unknown function (DUF4382)